MAGPRLVLGRVRSRTHYQGVKVGHFVVVEQNVGLAKLLGKSYLVVQKKNYMT